MGLIPLSRSYPFRHKVDFGRSLLYLGMAYFEAIRQPGLGALSDWIRTRALYAPIKSLTLKECSIADDTVHELSQIEGLELKWDGSHGVFSSSEICDNCMGEGCGECEDSD